MNPATLHAARRLRAHWDAVAVVLATAAFGLLLLVRPGGADVARWVDDVGTAAAACVAAGVAWRKAFTEAGRMRHAWAVIALGVSASAVGELLWGYYELVAHRDAPFPGVADVFYLLFYPAALVGLLLRSKGGGTRRGLRTALDGLLVAGSMFALSAVSVLSPMIHAGADGPLSMTVSLAYPVGDLLVLTVALIAVSRHRGVGLGLLALGMGAMAFSDSAFAALTAAGTYTSGALTDVGFVAAYLMMAYAARRDRDTARESALVPSVASTAAPYLPAAVALAVGAWALLRSTELLVGVPVVAVVVCLLARQWLVQVDNRALLTTVLGQQEELRVQAFHDPLTGLANRSLFADRVAHAVEIHRRHLRPVAVALLDLDDFKAVNDTLGHPAGDELLVRVAERLLAVTRASDTVARLGGDEFAILYEDVDDCYTVTRQLLEALDQTVFLRGLAVPVQGSIGIASLDAADSPVTADDLLAQADMAMYAAKRAGKGTVRMFDIDMQRSDELVLRGALVAAVSRGEIEVHYQPMYDAGGELSGFEALARWSHGGEPVPPARFIPLAHRAGVLGALDEHVLQTAVRHAAAWESVIGPVPVFVNLGPEQLGDPGLAERLITTMAAHGLPASRLFVEVPEVERAHNSEQVAATIATLRRAGIRIAIDDFGLDYVALARLRDMPPDIIKIDQRLIAPLASPGADPSVVAAVIRLAHEMGATVIAEGVEDDTQLTRLRAMGCDAIQGYLLGRPNGQPQLAAQHRPARETVTVPRQAAYWAPDAPDAGDQAGQGLL